MSINMSNEVTMVRIYLTEGQHQLNKLIAKLHDVYQVKGVTAFRGIAGFGQSGKMHSSTLIDVSLNLPVILEFFDTPEKIRAIVQELEDVIKPGHLVMWSAHTN
jgi:PII-like signaling protein